MESRIKINSKEKKRGLKNALNSLMLNCKTKLQ